MPTAGSMLVNMRKIFGDTAAQFIDDTTGLTWLDQAQQDFCNDVWMLEEIEDYHIDQYNANFDLPTDCIIPMSVMWFQSQTIKLKPAAPNVWDDLVENYPNSTGNAYYYTIMRRTGDVQQMRVGPMLPGASSNFSSTSGAISAAAATIPVYVATGRFRTRGWVLISNGILGSNLYEVAEYTGLGASTLTGVLRGVHGTVASATNGDVRVRQVDLAVRYKKMPDALATNSLPQIPEPFHRYLETYALYLAKLAHGEDKDAEGMLQVYLKQKETARKMAGRRQQDGLQRINNRRDRSSFDG
jgi:hypothetical protein